MFSGILSKMHLPTTMPNNLKQSIICSSVSAYPLSLYETSSQSANANIPDSGCTISFIMRFAHSLSSPPASKTLSPSICTLTSLCQFISLYMFRVVIRKLSLLTESVSAPCYQGILFFSNYNLNQVCLMGNSYYLT